MYYVYICRNKNKKNKDQRRAAKDKFQKSATIIIINKTEILRSSSGATPQALYHVSVGSTSRSTTWLPDLYCYYVFCIIN